MYITRDTTFEEIALKYPYLIGPLLEMGIKVIVCGDIQWGTLGEKIEELGLDEEEVLKKLNSIVEEKGGPEEGPHITLDF